MKQAQIGLDKKKKELGDGTVYSEIDGVVKAVRPADEAYNNSEAVVEVSGGGGYYITGALGELDLGKVKLGDTVDISSWMTGAAVRVRSWRSATSPRTTEATGAMATQRVLLPL